MPTRFAKNTALPPPSIENTIRQIVRRAAKYRVQCSFYGAPKDRWEPGIAKIPDRSACGRNGVITFEVRRSRLATSSRKRFLNKQQKPLAISLGPESQYILDMDEDLDLFTKEELIAEVKKLRAGIRDHRDSTKHELCWHHPQLWGLLPEKINPEIAVPAWAQFLRGCLRYRESLDQQLPNAPRVTDEFDKSPK
jgi:hypothetical protein